jgi:hypothetical protein
MRLFSVRRTTLSIAAALVLLLSAGCSNAPDVIQPKPGGAGGASAGGAGGKAGAGAGQGGGGAAGGQDAIDGGADEADGG